MVVASLDVYLTCLPGADSFPSTGVLSNFAEHISFDPFVSFALGIASGWILVQTLTVPKWESVSDSIQISARYFPLAWVYAVYGLFMNKSSGLNFEVSKRIPINYHIMYYFFPIKFKYFLLSLIF